MSPGRCLGVSGGIADCQNPLLITRVRKSPLLLVRLAQFNKHVLNLHYVPAVFWFPAQFKHE